jgi:hypothetical protein
MTRRPFRPDELDRPSVETDHPIAELESYLADTATGAPHGLARRVMAAVEQEPAPGRGLVGRLLAPVTWAGGLGRVARASVLAATLVIAVAGAIFAGQLTGLLRNAGNGSPSEVESVSPTPTQSERQSPTISPEVSPSESPSPSDDAHESPRASGNAGESEAESPEASDDESADESRTPRPTPTASPTPHP